MLKIKKYIYGIFLLNFDTLTFAIIRSWREGYVACLIRGHQKAYLTGSR